MSAKLTSGIAAWALMLTLLGGWSRADDVQVSATPEALAKALAQAGQPGPEHAKLQPLAGRWTYTGKFWLVPGQPPVETRGTIARKWILGGRFLQERCAGTGFDGKPGFEVLGLLGYDNVQRKYTVTWVCNVGTGTSTGVGTSPSSGRFTFQTACACPLLKQTIEGRDQIRVETPDKIVIESYKSVDGKEMKMMEIVSIRKK